MRNLCLFFLFHLISVDARAQSSGRSFFDKLYLPFGIGYGVSPGGGIQSGTTLNTGAEVRIKNRQGLFLRFDYNSRNNNYQNEAVNNTNVLKGEISANDFLLGVGYRCKIYKGIGAYALVQGGASNYSYPYITTVTDGYSVSQQSKMVPMMAGAGGIEFYFVKSAAIFIEGRYLFHMEQPFVKINSYDVIGISVGITTKLF
ncbi:hypothetical protein [Chitinophaga sp.]|uniref:hypothetical protein n=1 Tax=Chitinophaga sp. TaxID=1869181 RepID=UPI0031D9A7CE